MKNSTLWLISGIVLLIGGFLALVNPIHATLAVEIIIGIAFLISGLIGIYASIKNETGSTRLWSVLYSIAIVAIALVLLINPVIGAISLTAIIGVSVLVVGIAKIFLSFDLRYTDFFWALLVSGVISVILALVVLGYLPQAAAVTLGIILGVELIFSGVTVIGLSSSRRD